MPETTSSGAARPLIDIVNAGDGDDTIRVFQSESGDNIDGGAGTDHLDLSGLVVDTANVNLTTGVWSTSTTIASLTIAGIEKVTGGDGADVFQGSGNDDILDGGGGGDTITGNNGNDTILGGAGADVLRGGGGNDTMDGGSEDDFIEGGLGSNTILGGTGNDVIHVNSKLELEQCGKPWRRRWRYGQ